MKRIIAIKLVLFLLLGAVVNVGVAWWCAFELNPATTRKQATWRDQDWVHLTSWSERAGVQEIQWWQYDPDTVPGYVNRFPDFVDGVSSPEWSYVCLMRRKKEASPRFVTFEMAYGWPLVGLSLRAGYSEAEWPMGEYAVDGGLLLDTPDGERLFPLRPYLLRLRSTPSSTPRCCGYPLHRSPFDA